MAEGDHDFIKESSQQKLKNLTLDWEGTDEESLRKLKQTRGNKKGIVSRPQEEIRPFSIISELNKEFPAI